MEDPFDEIRDTCVTHEECVLQNNLVITVHQNFTFMYRQNCNNTENYRLTVVFKNVLNMIDVKINS